MAEIVNIDAETGDMTEFDSVVEENGSTIVNAADSALNGTAFGFLFDPSGTWRAYGIKGFSILTGADHRVRHHFDFSNLGLATDKTHLAVAMHGTAFVTYIAFRLEGSDFKIRGTTVLNSSAESSTPLFTLDQTVPHVVEIHTHRGNGDGFCRLLVDGVLETEVTSLVNHTAIQPDELWVGFTLNNASRTGTADFDEVIARDDDTEIGTGIAEDADVSLPARAIATGIIQ